MAIIPLDGQNATVPLDLSKSYESFEELIVRDQRKIVSGSLLLGGSPSAVPESTVVVVEYHNLFRDHYFMTALPEEIALLDSGQISGWHRTGEEFRALASGTVHANSLPVCRYYGRPESGLDTHFFSYLPFECDVLATESPQKWLLESAEIFRFPYPFTCDDEPNGRLLYRLFNNRTDSITAIRPTSACVTRWLLKAGSWKATVTTVSSAASWISSQPAVWRSAQPAGARQAKGRTPIDEL